MHKCSGVKKSWGLINQDLTAILRVSVTEIESGQTVVFEISVAKSDMGKVIGKKGRNAQALRTILSAIAGKTRKRYVLEIVE